MYAIRNSSPSLRHRSAGFSLVELTIVVVILGVLAMMGVPRYQVAVEKAKASEAYGYLAHVAKAQEMYRARTGSYSASLSALSIQVPTPAHFSVGTPSSINWETRWQLKLARTGASSGFGAYSVAWCEDGFDAAHSSIAAKLTPSGIGGSNQVSSGTGGSSGSGSSGGGSGGSAKENESGKKEKGEEQEKEKEQKEEKEKSNNGVGNGEGGGRDGNRGKGGGGKG
jgi:type IV pilus assembly protein PilA